MGLTHPPLVTPRGEADTLAGPRVLWGRCLTRRGAKGARSKLKAMVAPPQPGDDDTYRPHGIGIGGSKPKMSYPLPMTLLEAQRRQIELEKEGKRFNPEWCRLTNFISSSIRGDEPSRAQNILK